MVLTADDGPPWPLAKGSEEINAEGTNHRKVVAPRDTDFVTPRMEFWLEMPARHAPAGSELARRRDQSEANSPVPCQRSYVKRQYGGNTRLDFLMDLGVCWHYNVELAEKYPDLPTMGRPDGKRGAFAFYDDKGRLRWLDDARQIRPRYTEDGTVALWDPGGYGKPADSYDTSDGGDEANWRERTGESAEGDTVTATGYDDSTIGYGSPSDSPEPVTTTSTGGTSSGDGGDVDADTADDEAASDADNTTSGKDNASTSTQSGGGSSSGGGSGGTAGTNQVGNDAEGEVTVTSDGVEVPDWLIPAGVGLVAAFALFGLRRRGKGA